MSDTTLSPTTPARKAGFRLPAAPAWLTPSRRSFIFRWIVPVMIVVAGLLYWIIPVLAHPYAPENAPVPSSAAIESKYGIRITQIAVTADGGMVDFRYVVLDPDKAHDFAVDPASTPQLYPLGNNVIVSVTAAMPHKDVMQVGSTFFLLYHNTQGAIKSHSYVNLVLGDIKLNRIPVR